MKSKNTEDARQWLEFAESALEFARKGKFSKKVKYADLCYDTQQAVEKSLKALLVLYDSKFPRTHDIKHLTDLLKQDIDVPKIIEQAEHLTNYVSRRYPDDLEEITAEEYTESLKIAENIVAWASSIINPVSNKLF